MKFIDPTPDLTHDLERLQDDYQGLGERQRGVGRYLPIIVTGKSGTGKDTVWQATQKILEKDFGLEVPYSRSRYLTRSMRPGEEESHLNFISEEEFREREFPSEYKFAENYYGLDFSGAQNELEFCNVVMMNGYPNAIARMIDLFFMLTVRGHLPALVITYNLSLCGYNDLLEKRGGDIDDILRRRIENGSMTSDHYWYKSLSKYKHYNVDIQRNPSGEPERNQEHFNMNVVETVWDVLRHIEKYLGMTPKEIKSERVYFHQRHRDNRP